MIITLNWLKGFLDTDKNLEDILESLTSLGLEVEKVTDYSNSHGNFIVGEIIKAEKHPNADSLKKCIVNNGSEHLDIVCGAKNAREGIKVVLAPVGTIIPTNSMVIKSSKIRGEISNGMLCSYEELGLEGDSEGIIELPEDAIVGQKFIDYAGLNDTIIDISITPNRGDCLSVYGIARDLAALGIGKLKKVDIPNIKGSFESDIKVKLEDSSTEYFTGRYIKNIKNCESPNWLKSILELIGVKPKSLVVDVTNYINLTFGRPLHAYDADKINGNLTARIAKEGEKILALDDNEYNVSSMLVIADDNGPVALAGVIGGKNSAVDIETKNIFLEAAIFSPDSVIKSGRGLHINTDSRYRFERKIDNEFTDIGLDLATDLILKYAGGEASHAISAGSKHKDMPKIEFSLKDVRAKLGLEIDALKIEEILTNLGMDIKRNDEIFAVTPPSWRNDILIKEDIIEEIARIIGYDNIPVIPLPGMENLSSNMLDPREKFIEKSRIIVASQGNQEVITLSFIDEDLYKNFSNSEPVRILNPISSNLGVMRSTIIPNLLSVIKNNESRSIFDCQIFEIGSIFYGYEIGNEEKSLAIAKAGMVNRNHYLGQESFTSLDIKSDIFAVLEYANIADSVRIDREVPNYYHPAKSGRIYLGNKTIGYFGELHPSHSKVLHIRQNVAIGEIFLENIPYPKSKHGYKGKLETSEFQPVSRKFSFLVPKNLAIANIINEIKKVDRNIIKEVELFDYVTELDILENDERIAGISVVMQSNNETLTHEKIENIYNKIVETAQKLGAKFRES